jgi:hypothetical protein
MIQSESKVSRLYQGFMENFGLMIFLLINAALLAALIAMQVDGKRRKRSLAIESHYTAAGGESSFSKVCM